MMLNMGANKTEAFLRFNGKQQAACKSRLIAAGNKITTPKGRILRVVETYKYLGCTLSATMDPNADVDKRCQAAMTSYAPIAQNVFGSSVFRIRARLALGKSLVLSRLLMGVELWHKITAWAYRRINGVYMRLLRRIAGHMRGTKKAGERISDERVRNLFGAPSLSRLIAQRRLTYLGQLLRSRATFLLSLLASREQRESGWTAQVLKDLRCLWRDKHNKLAELGDPLLAGDSWSRFICDHPREWKEIVKTWTTTVDAFDCTNAAICRSRGDSEHVACRCGLVLKSARALAMHERMKHAAGSTVKAWAGATGVCCVCGTQLSTRLRLIAHLSDRRIRGNRQPCCSLLHRFPQVEAAEQHRLDELDKLARSAARRRGNTQPLSAAPAKRPRPQPLDAQQNCLELLQPVVKRRRITTKQPDPTSARHKRRRTG